jgi:two-component system KDP operon response regulator KdpE
MGADGDVILVLEDEERIRVAVADALRETGATVVESATGRDALRLASSERPDLFVVDLGLPDLSGVDVCREIRRMTTAPIIILSARHSESEKIALFEVGADDYVTKPFALREFAARVGAQIRRARTPLRGWTESLEIDGLTVDFAGKAARRGGTPIRLSPTEWKLLETLARHVGQTVTHQQLFDAVWQRKYGNPQQYLRVYVTHLRRKIEREPALPRIVITEPGVGYRIPQRDADA